MNSYEQKQAERAERLRERAQKKRAEANRLSTKHDALLRVMNGTPVLRGHHSERRHVRDLERIDRDKRKSFDAAREADDLDRRADTIDDNRSISSDDPEAATKLRAKAAGIRATQDMAKAINKTIGRRRAPQEIRAALETAVMSGALSIGPGLIAKLSVPDALGNYGVPAYKLRNWAAEIKRIDTRIAELDQRSTEAPRADVVIGDVTISEADNRVRLTFPGKPGAAERAALKAAGFRWSPTSGAWQRQLTDAGRRAAERVAKSLT